MPSLALSPRVDPNTSTCVSICLYLPVNMSLAFFRDTRSVCRTVWADAVHVLRQEMGAIKDECIEYTPKRCSTYKDTRQQTQSTC